MILNVVRSFADIAHGQLDGGALRLPTERSVPSRDQPQHVEALLELGAPTSSCATKRHVQEAVDA